MGGKGSMIGLELIMWSQGQWKAWKKTAPNGTDRQTNKQTNMATQWLNRPSGADSVKIQLKIGGQSFDERWQTLQNILNKWWSYV